MVCATSVRPRVHVFLSTGVASGESTQLGFEVDDIDAVVADLRARGVVFEEIDVPGFEVDGIMKSRTTTRAKARANAASSSATARATSSRLDSL